MRLGELSESVRAFARSLQAECESFVITHPVLPAGLPDDEVWDATTPIIQARVVVSVAYEALAERVRVELLGEPTTPGW